MTSRHLPKLIFAAALVLTVPLKAVQLDVRSDNQYQDFVASTRDMLARENFQARVMLARSGDYVIAQRGDCRLSVRNAVSYSLDALHTWAASEGRLSFAFDGALYPDYPALRVAFDDYRSRLLQKIGIDAAWRPVAAVMQSPACTVEALPWAEIAQVR